MQEDPRQFVTATVDVIDQQIGVNEKTLTAKAIESIVDHVHGSAGKIFEFSVTQISLIFSGLPAVCEYPAFLALSD